MNKIKREKGVTLVALIVTIVILIIIASVSVIFALNSKIIDKAGYAGKETMKQAATETINFKITNVQMTKFSEEQRLPTLKELADNFCEDNDFQYVYETTQIASLPPISSNNPSSIYTKLKSYPYEFEMNDSLQLASIDGEKLIEVAENGNDELETKVARTRTINQNNE